MDLKGRHFLTLKDYTQEEITYLLELSAELKAKKKQGILVDTLRGKNVALIFEKTSTRTRCSFEIAAHDLGMGTTYLDPKSSQFGKKESIEDSARVLGWYHISECGDGWVRAMVEKVFPGIAMELKISREWTYRELYLAVLEATAKICRVPKYRVYTVKELSEEVQEKMKEMSLEYLEELPVFVWFLAAL